jgi:nitric oxide reductase NorD protein
VRGERSISTLLLADLSQSTDAYASDTARVIDVIRDALYVFGEALTAVGDPFAMWGFSSVRRQNVRMQHIKGFDERWNDTCRARVGAIRPGYYTRMGAAIRHATAKLQVRPEHRRLLMLLTDGKPNDLDVYEGRYGLEDTRQAIHEARIAGITPFCVTIDANAHEYLPLLFGRQGYAMVNRPQDLVMRLTRAWVLLVS